MPMEFFRNCYVDLRGKDAPQMASVRSAVRSTFYVQTKSKSSPYDLCRSCGIETPQPEHDALNDAYALEILLRTIEKPIVELLKHKPETSERVQAPKLTRMAGIINIRGKSHPSFLFDKSERKVHKPDCPLIIGRHDFVGIDSIRTCVDAKLKTCDCCDLSLRTYKCFGKDKNRIAAVFYSKSSGSRIVHWHTCGILNRIPKKKRDCFNSLDKAKAAGYRLCKRCASIERFLSPVRGRIDTICRKTGIHFSVVDGRADIISKHDRWRIAIDELTAMPTLYHRNHPHNGRSVYNKTMPGYHVQAISSSHEITDLFDSIAEHDRYVERRESEKPVKQKRKKRTHEKQINQKAQTGKKRFRDVKSQTPIHGSRILFDDPEELYDLY